MKLGILIVSVNFSFLQPQIQGRRCRHFSINMVEVVVWKQVQQTLVIKLHEASTRCIIFFSNHITHINLTVLHIVR